MVNRDPWDEAEADALFDTPEPISMLNTSEPETQAPPEPEPDAPGALQGPYRPYGRHVVDHHMRRIASCMSVDGVADAEDMAAIIAEALNK